jgi:hypothetical protein
MEAALCGKISTALLPPEKGQDTVIEIRQLA